MAPSNSTSLTGNTDQSDGPFCRLRNSLLSKRPVSLTWDYIWEVRGGEDIEALKEAWIHKILGDSTATTRDEASAPMSEAMKWMMSVAQSLLGTYNEYCEVKKESKRAEEIVGHLLFGKSDDGSDWDEEQRRMELKEEWNTEYSKSSEDERREWRHKYSKSERRRWRKEIPTWQVAYQSYLEGQLKEKLDKSRAVENSLIDNLRGVAKDYYYGGKVRSEQVGTGKTAGEVKTE